MSKALRTCAQHSEGPLILDAAGLEHISSAGLRVIMRLVKRAPRELSIEGLEEIGQGATATVYRLDPETAVKVFKPGMLLASIEDETNRCRAAFVAGIPTAIPFDTVKVGDCYGSVIELLEAKNLADVLADDREHLVGNVVRFAKTMHELHQIEVDPDKFPSVSALSKQYVGYLAGTVCTEEETAKIRKVYENVPERNTFLHGDCHPGNVMLQDGEFVLIDLAAGGMGHPIFDMVSMYSMFMVSSASEEQRMQSPLLRSFSLEECHLIWRTFISAYLDTTDEALIRKAEGQIAALTNAHVILAAIVVPGLLTPERQRQLIDGACQAVDARLEPICFG